MLDTCFILLYVLIHNGKLLLIYGGKYEKDSNLFNYIFNFYTFFIKSCFSNQHYG